MQKNHWNEQKYVNLLYHKIRIQTSRTILMNVPLNSSFLSCPSTPTEIKEFLLRFFFFGIWSSTTTPTKQRARHTVGSLQHAIPTVTEISLEVH